MKFKLFRHTFRIHYSELQYHHYSRFPSQASGPQEGRLALRWGGSYKAVVALHNLQVAGNNMFGYVGQAAPRQYCYQRRTDDPATLLLSHH